MKVNVPQCKCHHTITKRNPNFLTIVLHSKQNEDILHLARSGQNIMEMWHTLYKDTRRQIELSGKGARWEFDQPLLFTRTDYIGTVGRDLGDVVQVSS